MRPLLLMMILPALVQGQDAPSLIEKLRSDRIEERDDALRGLKSLGRKAEAELQKAARDPDSELAQRARLLLRRLEIADRLSPALLRELPGVEDRLAASEAAWVDVLLQVGGSGWKGGASPTPSDIAVLVGPAVRAAKDSAERRDICDVFFRHRVYSSVGELIPFIRDREVSGKVQAVLRMLRAHEAVPALAGLLRDPDPRVRREVLAMLNEACTRSAFEAMLPCLEDRDPEVRVAALTYVGFGRERSAIPALIKLLPSEPRVVDSLWHLGAREAVPALVSALSQRAVWQPVALLLRQMDAQEAIPLLVAQADRDKQARPGTLSALAALGAKSEAGRIARFLEDPDPVTREAAVDALRVLGDRERIAAIRGRLRDESAEVRAGAARALTELEGETCASDLAALLKDPQEGVREAAAFGIGRIRARGQAGALVGLLSDKDTGVRREAAGALRRLRVPETRGALEKALSDESPEVRVAALEALADLGSRESLPAMLRLMTLEVPDVGGCAAMGLARMGARDALPEAERFVREVGLSGRSEGVYLWTPDGILAEFVRHGAGREVLALLKKDDEVLRTFIPLALQARGTRDLAPDLLRIMESVPELRRPGAEILGVWGAKEGIPALRALLRDEDLETQATAARALADLDVEEGVPAILATLPSIHFMSRVESLEVLARLGRRDVLPTVLKLVDDSSLEIRVQAVRTLGRLGDRAAVPRLTEATRDRFHEVRSAAIEALGRLGESPEGLRGLLDDPYGPARRAAAEALCRQGRREGASELMRDPRGLSPLNALRRPGVWKKLASLPCPGRLDGTREEVFAAIAKPAGMTFVPPRDPDVQDTLSLQARVQVRGRTLLDALEAAVDGATQILILEEDRLVLPAYDDGDLLWRAWWREERARR